MILQISCLFLVFRAIHAQAPFDYDVNRNYSINPNYNYPSSTPIYNNNNNLNPGISDPNYNVNYNQNYNPGANPNYNQNFNPNYNYNPNFNNYNPDYNYNYNTNNVIGNEDGEIQCPQFWLRYEMSCYKFIRSPRRTFNDAKRICETYSIDGQSALVSVNNIDEHNFLIRQLNWLDPQHRVWYIGAYQQTPNFWMNPDGSQLAMENAFLELESYGRDYLAYNFSRMSQHWGFQPVRGDEPLLYICEADIRAVQRLVSDDRSITYGINVDNPERIPRGPYFIKQPVDVTFDIATREIFNDVTLSCLAGGYPTPTYKWFKEEYENDRFVAKEVDPLSDPRYTVSGGNLIVHNPQQGNDYATYHCKAYNRFGIIISESAHLYFGFITEFIRKRSPESGDQNWGKTIFCDPPNHFPAGRYQWSRDYFPNFVEEDRRVFVSHDGALYFSALETVDRANYSCSVHTVFSESGRNGPFFPLMVNPHSNYQQLKLANNFPKMFPEAPIVGKEARLECVAFGYPVPSYNWERKGAPLPRQSYMKSFNRVLIIPDVRIEDQGEYICKVSNERGNVENSVLLTLQAEPNFTIPLTDKHADSRGELIWTCEAFGIPDVSYSWWRNGRQLVMGLMEPEDASRIRIQDNVLTISPLDDERDPGMYQCRASNTLRTTYSSAQLRVLAFKPSFKKHPLETETYAADGGKVIIKCNPEAAPKPEFVWKKDGIIIGAGGHRKILENGNLIIQPVSRDDGGLYTCTARNELGIDESTGRLIVLRGPRFIESLTPQLTISYGMNIGLHCYAMTDEMLDVAYVWAHNGLVIRDIDIKNSNNRLKIEGGYMSIINASFYDAGDYECIVKSAVGRISSKTTVTVEGPPGPPGGVQVMSIQKTQFILQWTDGATHGSPINTYTISGRTNWNYTWTNISSGVYATPIDRYTGRREAILETRLNPWSTYEFRVSAWNARGMGPFSAASPRHSTPPDVPYVAPVNIRGGGGKIGDLTILWSPLRSDQQNGPGVYYKVFWKRKEGEAEFQKLALKEFGNLGRAVVHIDSQHYYTEYIVKVQSFNSLGEGPISDETVIYSAEDMPQAAPQLVVPLPFNSTALNVTWKPIDLSRENIRGKLIGHRIKYWIKNEDEAVYYLSRTTIPWALIRGLIPDTEYYVKVMAYNSAGEGPESERQIARTYRMAPQNPPFAVHMVPINPSTLKVSWNYIQPSSNEEPLLGFKIRVWEYDQDISTANDSVSEADGGALLGYVNNLSPGKKYALRVLAFSNGGDGRMSSPELIFQMVDPLAYRSGSNSVTPHILMVVLASIYTLRTWPLIVYSDC